MQRAVRMPDPPGPPARYTMGDPGLGEVLLNRTNCNVIIRESGWLRFSFTASLPSCARIFWPFASNLWFLKLIFEDAGVTAGSISSITRLTGTPNP